MYRHGVRSSGVRPASGPAALADMPAPVRTSTIAFIPVVVFAIALCVAAPATALPPESFPPPPPTRVETVIDTVHGVAIADPYRWLEDFASEAVQTWADEQNDYTDSVLGAVPGRNAIDARLEELFEIPAIGSLWDREGRIFFMRRDPWNEQMVLYLRETYDAEPRVIVDPDELGSDDAPVSLDWWYPSYDGRLLAYGTSESGSEMSRLRIMDVDTGEHLRDEIPNTRAAGVSWLPDGTGFYYSRFPARGEVPDSEIFYHRKVYFHTIGDDPADDPLIYEDPESIYTWPSAAVSRDGRYEIVYAHQGGTRNDILFRDRTADGELTPLIVGEDARSWGPVIDGRLYLLTNLDAPMGRVFRVDLTSPARENWELIIPEGEHSISWIREAGDRLLVHTLENAESALREYSLQGEMLREIPLPEHCSVGDVTADWGRDDAFLLVSSFLLPPTVYRYSIPTGEMTEYMSVEAPVDRDPYVTEQIWYESKDGTRVSMFVTRRRDMPRDGSNPTLLNGYGGFGVATTPGFTRNVYWWLEHGGVLATANLRGGSEYGEAWHRDGMLENKQNTFDDFIAAAEWLIDNGYTSPERLAVRGGSNGGLLVGAFITQRPDLAAAAICDVPLLDMVRYHRFYGAMIWTPEYGDPDDPDQFEYLYAYSPYHRVDEAADHPAVFFTAGESDSRVHPAHAMKMTARLQALIPRERTDASGSARGSAPKEDVTTVRPVLLRLERQAGHGLAARMSRVREQYVDYYSFLAWQLGMLE